MELKNIIELNPKELIGKKNVSKDFIEKFGHDLFIRLFFEYSKHFLIGSDKIEYKTRDIFQFFLIKQIPGHVQNPSIASGTFLFKEKSQVNFELIKRVGERQISFFEIIPSGSTPKCTCELNLLLRDGCHCGSIERYKPKF